MQTRPTPVPAQVPPVPRAPAAADGADALPAHTARAAAEALDLGRSQRLVHVGGDGGLPAAFLDAWPQLTGCWFGPIDAQDEASRLIGQRGLADRLHYVCGTALRAIPPGDLVVVSAVDAAVERSLQLLVSAGPGWLPANGRLLLLQRAAPHLSSVVCPELLQTLGLRIASRWALAAGVQLLACAPAHRFAELASFARPGGQSAGAQR